MYIKSPACIHETHSKMAFLVRQGIMLVLAACVLGSVLAVDDRPISRKNVGTRSYGGGGYVDPYAYPGAGYYPPAGGLGYPAVGGGGYYPPGGGYYPGPVVQPPGVLYPFNPTAAKRPNKKPASG